MNWLFLYLVVMLVAFNNIKPWEAPLPWLAAAVCAGFAVYHQRRITALHHLAYVDLLTGAWNSNAGTELLEREIARARRFRTPLSIAYMDLDSFKAVNDTFGHEVGDIVLRKAVERVRMHCRAHDFIIRKGGDEFIIVFPGLDWADVRQKLGILTRVVQIDVLHLRVGASFGMATLASEETLDALLDRADNEMYRMKAQRKVLKH
jgi:diguanylate cyclase (GGDEF)-like protein